MAWLPSIFGGSSRQPRYEAIQDEEDGGAPRAHPRRRSRTRLLLLPRQRKAAGVLLLIDILIVVTLVVVLEPLITLLRRNDDFFYPRLQLHGAVATPDPPGGSPKIPRILHQTTANETIPEKWVDPQRSCKEAYKDYEYKVRHQEPGCCRVPNGLCRPSARNQEQQAYRGTTVLVPCIRYWLLNRGTDNLTIYTSANMVF